MKLINLEPGRRFQLPDSGRCGRLIRVSDFGATVKYDGQVTRTFRDTKLDQDVTFTSPIDPIQISSGTEVLPL